MISSASPLLRRRLFFQPRYSTLSMVTFPFSAAGAGDASPAATPSPATSDHAKSRTRTGVLLCDKKRTFFFLHPSQLSSPKGKKRRSPLLVYLPSVVCSKR